MNVAYDKVFNCVDPITKNICSVHLIHVQIDDVDERATEMTNKILDTSWLNKMDSVERTAFEACAERTIQKFVNEILNNMHSTVDTDFGEIMVSDTAQCVLESHRNHEIFPLADIIKERVSGNGGFDFHSESPSNIANYGEAKYSGCNTRYSDALQQINEFIKDKKDRAELITLRSFFSSVACENVIGNIKGYTAAFSIHAKNPMTIFKNAMESDELIKLLSYKEVYLIGVEIL